MQATPIVSIASISGAQPTQIIASSSCPSLAIATNPTQCIPNQGQQLALTSNQQSTQIIGTSQITLAPGKTDYIINILWEIMTKSKKLIYLKKLRDCSIIDGNHQYIAATCYVSQCNAAYYLLSGDDPQHFTTLRGYFRVHALQHV